MSELVLFSDRYFGSRIDAKNDRRKLLILKLLRTDLIVLNACRITKGTLTLLVFTLMVQLQIV